MYEKKCYGVWVDSSNPGWLRTAEGVIIHSEFKALLNRYLCNVTKATVKEFGETGNPKDIE